ncbi:MAG TPA: hypothetical protein VHQ47_03875 [Phycisphaerae bacterium]|nr:hypothetical protein [Phycisphaerae bacterium]
MRTRWWVVLGIGVVVGFLGEEVAGGWRLQPRGRAETLREFLAWRPGEQRFAEVEVGGKAGVLAVGPMGGLLSSGPSVYVYDGSGKLVDWTADEGDDSAFDGRWDVGKAWRGGMTRAEVERVAASEP